MGDGGVAIYDNGFYNIGVRPALEDLGVGGADPFGNPLSFARQYMAELDGKATPDRLEVDPCTFLVPFDPACDGAGEQRRARGSRSTARSRCRRCATSS